MSIDIFCFRLGSVAGPTAEGIVQALELVIEDYGMMDVTLSKASYMVNVMREQLQPFMGKKSQ